MKALKQLLSENIELVHYFRETEAVMDSVKAWLIQKRQQTNERKLGRSYTEAYYDPQLDLLGELLGELE